MILLGLGANLPHPRHGAPRATLEAALAALAGRGVATIARSGWWRSAPVPAADQPWFVNGVAALATTLDARALLAVLHAVERGFGRVRSAPNAARTLDLDLLDYDGAIVAERGLALPHPRLHERGFVLLPLREVAPDWRHPATGAGIGELIAALPPDRLAERL
jgi:2-amino-4-hydroxy-6-hydroxymethyldihydropteridine diphosphokinase